MDAALLVALALVLMFAFANGLHDASNAIATLVATRVARPAQALVLATVFNTFRPRSSAASSRRRWSRTASRR